jgi:DNA-binding response OmpR family regulator
MKHAKATKSILIVEDDSWLAHNHMMIMEVSGYDARSVSSSEAAIQTIDEHVPDVIVLDVMLEGGTAFALMHELQSYEDTSRIPIILCSNIPGELLDHTALERYGVRIVLDKSTMRPYDLLDAVERVKPLGKVRGNKNDGPESETQGNGKHA